MLVVRAASGDAAATAELVAEFQDVALAIAVGSTGEIHAARDVAQEAFVVALTHLGELRTPAAFPGWFAQVIRTTASRHHRSQRASATSLAVVEGQDPADVVLREAEHEQVWAAIRALPEHERTVITLHYLGDLTYPAIARLLEVSPAAVKKRAFDARRHLKEHLTVATHALVDSRPSVSGGLAPSVALFIAIRRGDHATARDLLAKEPHLVDAKERWAPDDAMRLGLQHAESGVPLVRAVQTGDVAMVKLVLAAGAAPDAACACNTGESALWAAAHVGDPEIIDLLLAVGADINAPTTGGVTPLILAAQLGDHDLVGHLLAVGADPTLVDDHGRCAADWLAHHVPRLSRHHNETLETGVRAVDLLAPLVRGAAVHIPPAWEVGAFALIYELVRAVAPDEFWQIGFETGPYDTRSAEQSLRQLRMSSTVRLIPGRQPRVAASQTFAATLTELERSPGTKIVLLVAPPERELETLLALARLLDDENVVLSVVVVPGTQVVSPPSAPPEGYHAQFAFDPWRAEHGLYPALDPNTTTCRRYPTEQHEQIAQAARKLLDHRHHDHYPDDDSISGRLLRYLAQPFSGWEHQTGSPGQSTPLDETLRTVERILTNAERAR